MANTKHEDAILKMGFDYFRDTILKTLGIDYEFVETGATELVELTIHSLYMDFTFLYPHRISDNRFRKKRSAQVSRI